MCFQVTTDSTVDLSYERMQELGVPFVAYPFRFDGKEYRDDMRDETKEILYNALKQGKEVKTGQGPMESIVSMWEPILSLGENVLHIAFSSALSGTINAANVAREDLLKKYPCRKIYILDSLCGSAGHGLLVEYAVGLRDNRLRFEEVCEMVEKRKLHVEHWFTADDLTCLKRSGRVPNAVMFIATLLHIKPILYMPDDGTMTLFENVRGRIPSLKRLVERMSEKLDCTMSKAISISHADCIQDALKLKDMILAKFPNVTVKIYSAGAIVSAHVGRGSLGLFFFGKAGTRMSRG